MSIKFLHIKYFIIFVLLKHSTAMTLKYKYRKNFDYKYHDWEEKRPDIYDYFLITTNQTSTTESNTESSPHETTSEITTRSIYENLTVSYPTFSLTLSTDTSSTIPSTESLSLSPLSILSSLSTSSYITTTTTNFPDVTTGSILSMATTLSSAVTLIDPVIQSVRNQIEDAKFKLRGGYFTASIYILLKIIEKKNSKDVTFLLDGLHSEITRLNSRHRLAMFGPIVTSVFTSMVRMMATAPVELIQLQAKNGIELIENKKQEFQADTKAIFDVVDAIYTEEDYINIVEALADIQNFPNVSKHGTDVAKDTLIAFIFIPYTRVEGTAKEKLLLMEINNVVQKRMFIDEGVRRHIKKYDEITTKMTASSENITKFIETQINKALRTPTPANSFEKDYTSYVRDLKTMKRLKHQMKIYKKKFKQIRMKERKLKTKRGPTTTTTTTTTTVIPPMRKSKYYIRKYVKKNLYKMKTTTKKTTSFTWRYYGKIRKFNDDDNIDLNKSSLSNYSSEEGYYSAYKSNEATPGFKSVIEFKTNKNVVEDSLGNDNVGEESKVNNKIQRLNNERDSSDSNAEAYLQVNLNDALVHTNNKTIDRRFINKKVNDLRVIDSFSDDEAILKGNIYKVFGYRNDFSKQLRAIL